MKRVLLPLLNWIYALSGKIDRDHNQYILLSSDLLSALNLSLSCDGANAKRIITNISKLDPGFVLLSATSIFNLDYIPGKEDSKIINPLQHWPYGGVCVAVPLRLTCKAFSNCTTPAARGLSDLFAKCMGRIIEAHAQAKALDMGEKKFEEEVAAPATKAVKEAAPIITPSEAEKYSAAKLIEMEIQLLKMESKLAEAEKDKRGTEVEQLEQQQELLSLKILYKKEKDNYNNILEQNKELTRQARLNELEAVKATESFKRHCHLNRPITSYFSDEPARHHLEGTLLISLTGPKLYPDEALDENEAFINFNFTSARVATLRERFNKSKSALKKFTGKRKNQVIGFFAGAVGGVHVRDKLNRVVDREIQHVPRRPMCGIVNLNTVQGKVDTLARELKTCYATGATLNTSFIDWDIIPEDEVEEYKAMDRESCQEQGKESWLKIKTINLDEEEDEEEEDEE